MAIKVALAAALLVALVAVGGATTFTTTVTTTSFDNPQSQCSQMLQGHQFHACQSYLRQRGNVLEMATGNPQAPSAAEECCQSLKDVERKQAQCGCEAIKQAVRQMQGGGQMGQSEEVYRKARMLPRTCGLRTQECQFNVIFV